MRDSFWKLSSPESLKGLAEWDDTVKYGEGVRCPVNPGHGRGGRRVTDLSVLLTSKTIPDFVWTWYSDCLIQDHVLRFFREQGFTGFDVRPAHAHMKIRAKQPDPCDDNPGLVAQEAARIEIPTLWELVITGWAGMARAESGVKITQHCPACSLTYYSCFTDPTRLIDESQWDGSDFFMVWPLPAFIFITDRVAQAIRRRRLRGAQIRALTTLRCHSASISPGRLSDWMPERRARELGEPLGIY